MGYVVDFEACKEDLCASSLREILPQIILMREETYVFINIYKQNIRTLCKHCNLVFYFIFCLLQAT